MFYDLLLFLFLKNILFKLTFAGTIQIIGDVVRAHGIKGLYTGIGPRLMRVGLDRAFGFLAFEWVIDNLKVRTERRGAVAAF